MSHVHQLSPVLFLSRAAQIEPDAVALHHEDAKERTFTRTYRQTAERSAGLAYFCRKQSLTRVGILCPNTPAFLEALFAVNGTGGTHVAINHRLKAQDIEYIFDHAEVDTIIVDQEYEHLLELFRQTHPEVIVIVDLDQGGSVGPYEDAVQEGLSFSQRRGSEGWSGLMIQAASEHALMSLSYTSGTTARPKGVEYTHRGVYLAALANVIESGLNNHHSGAERCHYLWTLPVMAGSLSNGLFFTDFSDRCFTLAAGHIHGQ